MKDDARSSLPQYLQTSFSELEAARDDCGDRGWVFIVFAARAAFGLPPIACFFSGAADLPLCVSDTSGAGLASVFKLDLLLGQGLGAPAVVNTHCSVAAMLEANSRTNL
jgi:hypothetical protein